ncbi:MAG: hypothetical protein FJ271_20610 [Planctomycetes bacterium]|nr:hypothetical protein [Planctomycetota bacterium]
MARVPLLLCGALLLPQRLPAAPTDFDTRIRPIIVRHCVACHGAEKPKRDLRLDRISTDFNDPATLVKWQEVLKRVAAGEMPPKAKPQPTAAEIRTLSHWISAGVRAAEARRRAEGRVVLRRLNRVEDENRIIRLERISSDEWRGS